MLDKKIAQCTGTLPGHAVWTVSQIVQEWSMSDGDWMPIANEMVFSEDENINKCAFKCDTNYTWKNNLCVADTKENVACTGRPENAVWNTVSEINQTWNGEMWWPSENAEYNETSSGSECRYKCVDGYFWNDHRCNKPLPLGNICTGQTKCYDNSHEETDCPALGEDLFGQDAWYAENGYCAPKKFTIDSTVEDQKTVIDLNTGLEWQDIRGGSDYTWLAALEYCKNLTYAGFSDWRLPDLNELLSLINDDKISPASDLTNVAKMPYWTSTSSMTDPSEALYINFSTGRIGASDKTTSSSRYVKCVR